MKKMRMAYVLWVSYENYRSGGEEFAINLCKYMSLRGHETTLISPGAELQADLGETRHLVVSGLAAKLWSVVRSPSRLQVDIGNNAKLTIKNVSLRRIVSGLAMGLWSLGIPSALDMVNPDVVISHNIFPPYFCERWADKHGKLFVNNFCHIEPPVRDPVLGWRYPLFKLFNLKWGNCIYVAISRYQMRLMERLMKKVSYIGMGCDNTTSLDSSKEDIILYLGKINRLKQVPLLLRAWKKIDHDGWKLVLAGDGSDYDYCVKYAKDAKLTDYEFLGYVTDEEKWQLYSEAKLFAFPSLYEGFGMVLLEALSRRCVPIINDAPPMNEIITPEVGFVASPTVNDWATALHKGMSYDLAKKQGQADKVLSKYQWSTVCDRLERVVEMYAG